MAETLLSVGIDIGTSTTQLVISRLTLENRANLFSVPRVAIAGREVLYRSAIHFTPLLSDTVIDAQGVRAIVEEEYRKSGFSLLSPVSIIVSILFSFSSFITCFALSLTISFTPISAIILLF